MGKKRERHAEKSERPERGMAPVATGVLTAQGGEREGSPELLDLEHPLADAARLAHRIYQATNSEAYRKRALRLREEVLAVHEERTGKPASAAVVFVQKPRGGPERAEKVRHLLASVAGALSENKSRLVDAGSRTKSVPARIEAVLASWLLQRVWELELALGPFREAAQKTIEDVLLEVARHKDPDYERLCVEILHACGLPRKDARNWVDTASTRDVREDMSALGRHGRHWHSETGGEADLAPED